MIPHGALDAAVADLVSVVRRPEFQATASSWCSPSFETCHVGYSEHDEGATLIGPGYCVDLKGGAATTLSGAPTDVISAAKEAKRSSDFLGRRDRVRNRLEQKYGAPIGSGRGRIVFGNDRVVIKLPRTPEGEVWNEIEAEASNLDDRFARARRMALDVYCVMMERLGTDLEPDSYRSRPTLRNGGYASSSFRNRPWPQPRAFRETSRNSNRTRQSEAASQRGVWIVEASRPVARKEHDGVPL